MSTYMAKPETVERGWYIIDAAGKPLGKTAVTAANILRGKHRPEFTPHVDCGEYGSDNLILTGADNVFKGAKVPAALVGAKLPGGIEIAPRKMQGMMSYGMLC